MSGEWSLTSPAPIRPGFYITFQTIGAPGAAGGQFGTVGMPIVADWGPINEFTTIRTVDELDAAFGEDVGTGAATTHLVREALIGGASAVKVYRLDDGTAAKSSVTLVDQTGGTPLTLILTAKHEGIRPGPSGQGGGWTATVRASPVGSGTTHHDLIIYEGTRLLEKYTFVKTDAAGLRADITANSAYVDVSGTATTTFGTSLVLVTGSAFSAGDSGTSVVAADYTDAQDAFEREGGFDVFSLDGVSTDAIVEAAAEWAINLNALGNYTMLVVGGAAAETASAAVTRTLDYDSEFVVSIHGDHFLTLRDDTEDERGSSMLSPRIAGMIAAAGTTGSITRGEIPGVRIKTPNTKEEAEELIQGGVISLYKRGTVTIVEDGVTSFTSFTDDKDETFATISNVRVMQQMGMDLNEIFETKFLGKIRNTEAARQSVKAAIESYLKTLEAKSVLINGSTVALDTRYTNTGHSIYLSVNIQFALELKKILVGVRAPAFA